MAWSVYIVECRDGSYYTGVSTDVSKRVCVHNKGKGAKYTRSRRPVRLIWSKTGLTKRDAFKLEYSIKRLSRRGKEKFIARTN